MIHVEKTGNIVTGDVLDVNKKYLERALKDYDPQLYIKWNPKKNNGNGLWEVRRKPEHYVTIAKLEDGDDVYRWFDYRELDLVNHVLDVGILGYNVLTRIKQMDSWAASNRGQHFVRDMEYNEYKWREKAVSAREEERRRILRENQTLVSDLKNALLSGASSGQIARYWK